MKNIVRASVIALVLTGISASAHIASASTQPTLAPKVSAVPVPVCPPDGTTDCGLGCVMGACAI